MINIMSGKGTLLLSIPSKDGLVVCADKRENIQGKGVTDQALKIQQVGTYASVGFFGNVNLYNAADNWSTLYTFETVVNDFFAKKKIRELSVTFKDFGRAIERDFNRFLRTLNVYERPADEPADPNRHFVNVCLWYIPLGQKVEAVAFRFMYRRAQGLFLNSIAKLDTQKPIGYGNISVFEELRGGNNPEFNEAREDALIKRLLVGGPVVTAENAEEAISLAKKAVLLSHQMSGLLRGEGDPVGPTLDCALIDYTDGFNWICENCNANE